METAARINEFFKDGHRHHGHHDNEHGDDDDDDDHDHGDCKPDFLECPEER